MGGVREKAVKKIGVNGFFRFWSEMNCENSLIENFYLKKSELVHFSLLFIVHRSQRNEYCVFVWNPTKLREKGRIQNQLIHRPNGWFSLSLVQYQPITFGPQPLWFSC